MPTEYRISSLGKTAMLTVTSSPEDAAYFAMAKMQGENLFISPDLFADFLVIKQKGGKNSRLTEAERGYLTAFFFGDAALPLRRVMLSVNREETWLENRGRESLPHIAFCMSKAQ